MFMNITTTGEYAWTPSSGVLPFEFGKNCLDNLNILKNSGDSEDPTLQEKYERKIKKDQMKKLKKKFINLIRLKKNLRLQELQNWFEGSKTSNVQNEMQECDIPQVIDVLNSLPGIEIGKKKVMFMSMKQPDLKLNWLKYNYGLGSSS
ncbi:hypothetical protein UlMin_032159 [Ulmus minor]